MSQQGRKRAGEAPGSPSSKLDPSQRPQRPIRLKPGIAAEATARDLPDAPPAEILGQAASPAGGQDSTPENALALPSDVRARAEAAARAAGMDTESWLRRVVERAAEAGEPAPLERRLERLEARVGEIEAGGFWARLLGRRGGPA